MCALGTLMVMGGLITASSMALATFCKSDRLMHCHASRLTRKQSCWRNGGLGEKAEYWQDMGSGGPIFKAVGKGDIMGVRFGESRAEQIAHGEYANAVHSRP